MDIRSHNPDDAATYLLAAKSFLSGKGFGVDYADQFVPNIAQGPLFPLLLTPVVSLFGFHFLSLKLYVIFLSLGACLAAYFFFRTYLNSREEALLALLLFAGSPIIYSLSHEILSETLFIAFLLLTVWTWDQVLWGKGSKHLTWVAPFFAAAAFYTRPMGLAVLFGGWALLLHPSYRNKKVFKRLILLTLFMMIVIGPWFYRAYTVESIGWLGQDPFHFFRYRKPDLTLGAPLGIADLFIRFRQNLTWGIIPNIGSLLFAPFYLIVESRACLIGSLPLAGWVLWRWASAFYRNPTFMEGVLLIWAGVLLLFTQGYALRYLVPVFPFLILYMIRFGREYFSRNLRRILATFLVMASIGTMFLHARDLQANPYGTPVQKAYVAAGEWAKAHLGKEATYFAAMPHRWQVLSQGRAYALTAENLAWILQGKGPEYLLTFRDPDSIFNYDLKSVEFYHPSDTAKVSKYVQSHPRRFRGVYQNSLFAIYQRKPPKSR